ncbi:tRNA uridine-5-carboxymethylaminomethyl(34) synthesis GTPase MnmE [Sphingomonas sp. 28-62-20]|uniref:tRNA uridine-5-carboxymethylaminomethyl(34) synthesis GTPase MnmE n=1 Tax=Sphingomonas sp. 28-62-20 TaxID=1970433 RepID=UPI00269B6581
MATIFAVASGPPPAAIAVMRISGPLAIDVATRLAGTLPPPRRAAVRALRSARGSLLDRALVIVFPGPNSVTGEDMVELHLHGGRAVVAAVAEALAAMDGVRPAVAGEFTRRALIAGRIDLAEAEGLGDLLAAETESQRRAALRVAEGAISRAVEGWRLRVLAAAATIEAALDFADEDDVGAPDIAAVCAALHELKEEIERMLGAPPVERLRDGVRVVLAGPPNSGKSTLLNALVEREAAIVSPIAGTTRDRIEQSVVRGGMAFILTDTAGLAEGTDDAIEAIGVARAKEAMAGADLVLWLGEDPPAAGSSVLWLAAQADRLDRSGATGRLAVSAVTGAGISALWAAIVDRATSLVPREDQLALNARQRGHCADCAAALRAAVEEEDMLVVAEQLRLARGALDRITGAAQVEDMLDALFSRFCIGK